MIEMARFYSRAHFCCKKSNYCFINAKEINVKTTGHVDKKLLTKVNGFHFLLHKMFILFYLLIKLFKLKIKVH